MLAQFQRTKRFINGHPLARKRKAQAWRNWVGWQIRSRFARKPVICPWIEDSVLVVERGMTGATGNLYCGLHEFEDMALILHFFGGDSSGGLFDIGANVGSFTALAAKVGGAWVQAFEPVPLTYSRLQRNVRVNGIESQVVSHQTALGRSEGELIFSMDRDAGNQVVEDDYVGETCSVRVAPLDDIAMGESAAVWKIDVEGFESEVLAGAEKSLSAKQLQVLLIEGDSPAVQSTLKSAGFSRRYYDVFRRQFLIERPVSWKTQSGNHIWVRDVESITHRCRASRRFSAMGVEF